MSRQEEIKNGQNKDLGPADLDEVIKKFSRKIGELLGKKPTVGGGDSKISTPKSMGLSIGLILGVVALIWGLAGIFIVSPAEQSVILLFGKYQRTVGPGPHWVPRFVESETTVNVQKISTYSYASQMLTQDQNIVDVSVAVQYKISDTRKYLYSVVNPTASLQQATASALRQVIGNTTLDQVLTTGRAVVRDQIRVQLQKILSMYHVGLNVTDVALQPARAPEQVKAAFDDAIKAQEDEQRYKNQAEAYAMGVVPVAEGRAKRIMQEAKAYKQQVVLTAKAEVARFLAILPVYQAAPSVTRNRLYLSTIEGVLKHSNKVFVDTALGHNLLYLPLDKLISKKAVAAKADTADAITQSLTSTGDLSSSGSTSSARPDRFTSNPDSNIG